MKTTVKHVGSVREWEGPIENWEKHVHEIKHWCDGGEVEIFFDNSWIDMEPKHPRFNENYNYRKKQREPKHLEVWLAEEFAYVRTEINGWTCIESGTFACPTDGAGMSYASPSVESYYARKFLDESKVDLGSNARIGDLLRLVHKSAQLDH